MFDLDAVREMLGITICRAPLGEDLNKARHCGDPPSG